MPGSLKPFLLLWPPFRMLRFHAIRTHYPEATVGHHQTKQHRPGKQSYHQIGLVRGQFGNVPEDQWRDWIAKTGFDGWEEASWELDLAACLFVVGVLLFVVVC